MALTCPHCNRKIPLALFTAHIGRVGGSKTSEAKKRSSRLNGLKGGRPKKKGIPFREPKEKGKR